MSCSLPSSMHTSCLISIKRSGEMTISHSLPLTFLSLDPLNYFILFYFTPSSFNNTDRCANRLRLGAASSTLYLICPLWLDWLELAGQPDLSILPSGVFLQLSFLLLLEWQPFNRLQCLDFFVKFCICIQCDQSHPLYPLESFL